MKTYHKDRHLFKSLTEAQFAQSQRVNEHIFKIGKTYFVGTPKQYLKRIS